MNIPVAPELKVVVERAVRPLPISHSRKRKVHEELLAHLLAIHAEELARHGDTSIALEQATLRFGDPVELSSDLQKSIPRFDRVVRLVENLRYQPEESLLMFAGRHLLASVVGHVAGFVAMLPILLYRGRLAEYQTVLLILLVAGAVSAALSAVFCILVDRVSRALHGTNVEKSRRMAVFYCALASLIFPVMSLLIYGGLTRAFPPPGQALFAAIVAPLVPVMLILISRQAADEIREYEEWQELDLSQ